MPTFTQILYRYLKQHPDTPLAVKEWKADLQEPAEQVTSYAGQLHEDVALLLRSVAVSFGPDEDETQMLVALAEAVLARVVWSRIARALLKHFGGAAEQAGYSVLLPSLVPSIN